MLELFGYRFFTHALLAAFFASITCGFIGTYIVTRRLVFISGGISHASFGGVGAAYYFGYDPIIGAAVFSVLSAVGIEAFSRKSTLRKDTLIGILWSFGMALGVIFVYITPGYAANLMTYLFGNILTVTTLNLYLMAGLTLAIIFFFGLLFKEILFIAFDEDYSRTQGMPVKTINYLLLGLAALTIVINIRVVGIILVISLLTIPQATANLVSKNFKSIIFYSIGFGFISSLAGLLLSYKFNIPSGATIIFCSIFIFLLTRLGVYIKVYIKELSR